MFLSEEQLFEMIDRKRPSDQIAWLKKNAIHHFVSASGRPKVLNEALHERRVTTNGPQAHPRLRLAAANAAATKR